MGKPKLRVGIANTTNVQVSEPNLRDFCQMLSDLATRPVDGDLASSYSELARGVEEGRYDVVWLPPRLAASLLGRGAARALVVPVRGGTAGYWSALFSREDSGLTDLDQLQGKTVGWVDRESVGGYLLARAMLESRGHEPSELFAAELFLGSHDRVADAVFAGEVDVGATYATFDGDRVVRAGWRDLAVNVIARHGPAPADVLAVNPSFDPDLERRLRSALTTDPKAAVTRFARMLLDCESFVTPDAAGESGGFVFPDA